MKSKLLLICLFLVFCLNSFAQDLPAIKKVFDEFQSGYNKRDTSKVENFGNHLFARNIFILGTGSQEWITGLSAAKRLVKNDWAYWLNLSIDTTQFNLIKAGGVYLFAIREKLLSNSQAKMLLIAMAWDNVVALKACEIMLLKKGIYTMSEYVTENEPFEALMIFVPNTFLQTLQLHGATSRVDIKQQNPYTLISSTSILESFKTEYLQYFRKPIESMESLLQLKLQELLLLLLSGIEKDRTSNFLRTIVASRPLDIEYVVKTYQFQPITLQELATLSGRSLASFKRDFQQKYNFPPRQWINIQRLSHARRSILNSNKLIAEVAYECGFESPSHFIKLFKKRFGVTPSMLRTEGAMI